MIGHQYQFDRTAPFPSILRQSVGARVLVAGIAAAALWLALLWAIG